MQNKFNYLNFIPYYKLPNWSVQFTLEEFSRYNNIHKMIPLGTILKRRKDTIDILNEELYKRVTIKMNNSGICLRDIEFGKNIGTKIAFIKLNLTIKNLIRL